MLKFTLRVFVPTMLCLVSIGVWAAEIQTSVISIDAEGQSANQDWPWWRGPWRTGEANPNQNPPTSWSETENIVWRSPIPGRGHSSPIVVGNAIYLATSDETTGSQSLLCYNRTTGKKVWQTVVHENGGMVKNKKATMASSTAAFDGERLFINFPNNGALYTTALSPEGDILWQTKINDYVIHQGYGSSPAIYKHLVIVSADNKGGGAIAGLDRKTGDIVWKQPRPKLPNYPSPVILNVAGKDQVFMSGCKLVTSFDPLTGEKNWEVDGATEECVTSTVTDGTHIFSSGGYPRRHIAAIRADGSKKIDWDIPDQVYVPSFVIRGTHMYGVRDDGIASCWDSMTGKALWTTRLGGKFTSSLVLVGDLIYATSEAGTTYIFKADPTKLDVVARNQLGDESFATQTICGSRIYMRVNHRDDSGRQEYLYCIGSQDQ